MLRVMKVPCMGYKINYNSQDDIKIYSHTVPPDKLDEDPNYNIVKITVHNEVGSLNRILKAFRVSIIS